MMHACMQIVATLVKLLVHDMIGRTHYSDDCTNPSLQLFTPRTGMCSPHKYQITPSPSALPVHNWIVTTQDVLTTPVPHF